MPSKTSNLSKITPTLGGDGGYGEDKDENEDQRKMWKQLEHVGYKPLRI